MAPRSHGTDMADLVAKLKRESIMTDVTQIVTFSSLNSLLTLV